MKKLLSILALNTTLLLSGCASTDKNTGADAPPTMPESYQTMVDFGIIKEYQALEIVKGQRKALSDNFYRFQESAFGQLTDDGNMFVGFGIAQLLGGGVSLMDFFNPLSMLGGNNHKNHFKKTFFWVEVEEDCDKACAEQKVEKIVELAAKEHSKNLLLLNKEMDTEYKWEKNPDAESAIREDVVRGAKKSFFGKVLSKSYINELLITPDGYDPYYTFLHGFFSLWDGDFTEVNGKRYYGSRVTTTDYFTASLHRMGQHFRWDYDNSKTLGFAKASETFPDFILVETQNCISEVPLGTRGKVLRSSIVRGCQGDLMITKGKVTYMHLFPKSTQKNLEMSNMIGAKIHDAREEIFTKEEWKALFEKNNAVETAKIEQ